MTALIRGNHWPNPHISLGMHCAGSGTAFSMCTSLPNSFSIVCTCKYTLHMAEPSFWHRRDRNCTHLSTTTFINISQLLHFYKQMATDGFLQFPRHLGKRSRLIFPFQSSIFLENHKQQILQKKIQKPISTLHRFIPRA